MNFFKQYKVKVVIELILMYLIQILIEWMIPSFAFPVGYLKLATESIFLFDVLFVE